MWIIDLCRIAVRISQETLRLHNIDHLLLLKVRSHLVKNDIGTRYLTLQQNINNIIELCILFTGTILLRPYGHGAGFFQHFRSMSHVRSPFCLKSIILNETVPHRKQITSPLQSATA
jgi:hypothetical protein